LEKKRQKSLVSRKDAKDAKKNKTNNLDQEKQILRFKIQDSRFNFALFASLREMVL
jgi:exopolysaccharide biosynthesis protein